MRSGRGDSTWNALKPEAEFEWKILSGVMRLSGIGAHVLPGLRCRDCAPLCGEGACRTSRRPIENVDGIQGSGRSDWLWIPRSRARGSLASCGHSRWQDRQLSPIPTDALERESAGIFTEPLAPTKTRCRIRQSSKKWPDKFKGIDIMRASAVLTMLPCGVHMYLGDGKVLEQNTLRCSEWRGTSDGSERQSSRGRET